MSEERRGFGMGLALGAVFGFVAGAVLVATRDRSEMDGLMSKGIELKVRATEKVDLLRTRSEGLRSQVGLGGSEPGANGAPGDEVAQAELQVDQARSEFANGSPGTAAPRSESAGPARRQPPEPPARG